MMDEVVAFPPPSGASSGDSRASSYAAEFVHVHDSFRMISGGLGVCVCAGGVVVPPLRERTQNGRGEGGWAGMIHL